MWKVTIVFFCKQGETVFRLTTQELDDMYPLVKELRQFSQIICFETKDRRTTIICEN